MLFFFGKYFTVFLTLAQTEVPTRTLGSWALLYDVEEEKKS